MYLGTKVDLPLICLHADIAERKVWVLLVYRPDWWVKLNKRDWWATRSGRLVLQHGEGAVGRWGVFVPQPRLDLLARI